MAVEQARANPMPKPWGVADLRPWSRAAHDDTAIGEIWFERPDAAAADSALLLKLLFTSQKLSIQVHPDDAYARTIGLPRGKTEAWYVLRAAPDAEVALGLTQPMTAAELRDAINTGEIENLVSWRAVSTGDVILVPAGTIHAIGAGLVLVEIQQRSDATFRLFDYGRQRELHIDNAIAVADTGPAGFLVPPIRLTDERTLLVANPHFMFEKIELAPNSTWRLQADRETWLLVLSGGARTPSLDLAAGDVLFAQSDNAGIDVGATGMTALVARTGGDAPHLLQRIEGSDGPQNDVPTGSLPPRRNGSPNARLEITK